MKKLVSILLVLTMLTTLLCAIGLPVSAEEGIELYRQDFEKETAGDAPVTGDGNAIYFRNASNLSDADRTDGLWHYKFATEGNNTYLSMGAAEVGAKNSSTTMRYNNVFTKGVTGAYTYEFKGRMDSKLVTADLTFYTEGTTFMKLEARNGTLSLKVQDGGKQGAGASIPAGSIESGRWYDFKISVQEDASYYLSYKISADSDYTVKGPYKLAQTKSDGTTAVDYSTLEVTRVSSQLMTYNYEKTDGTPVLSWDVDEVLAYTGTQKPDKTVHYSQNYEKETAGDVTVSSTDGNGTYFRNAALLTDEARSAGKWLLKVASEDNNKFLTMGAAELGGTTLMRHNIIFPSPIMGDYVFEFRGRADSRLVTSDLNIHAGGTIFMKIEARSGTLSLKSQNGGTAGATTPVATLEGGEWYDYRIEVSAAEPSYTLYYKKASEQDYSKAGPYKLVENGTNHATEEVPRIQMQLQTFDYGKTDKTVCSTWDIDNVSVYSRLDKGSEPPVVSNVIITGNASVGSELTVSYQYTDANQDEEEIEKRKITWQSSENGKTDWSDIAGETGASLTVTQELLGKYIRVTVQAFANAEPYESNLGVSGEIGPIEPKPDKIILFDQDFENEAAGDVAVSSAGGDPYFRNAANLTDEAHQKGLWYYKIRSENSNQFLTQAAAELGTVGASGMMRYNNAYTASATGAHVYEFKGRMDSRQMTANLTYYTEGTTFIKIEARGDVLSLKTQDGGKQGADAAVVVDTITPGEWYEYKIEVLKDATYYLSYKKTTDSVFVKKGPYKLAETTADGIAVDYTRLAITGMHEQLMTYNYEKTDGTALFTWDVDDVLAYVATEELAEDPVAPVVSNVSITGEPMVGSTLTASYYFTDDNGDEEDTDRAEIRWEASENGESGWQAIAGASGAALSVTKELIGKYIRAGVKAYAVAEPFESNTAYSKAAGPVFEEGAKVEMLQGPSFFTALDYNTDNKMGTITGGVADTQSYRMAKINGDMSQYLVVKRVSSNAGYPYVGASEVNLSGVSSYDWEFKTESTALDAAIALYSAQISVGDKALYPNFFSIRGRRFSAAGTNLAITNNEWYRVHTVINLENAAYTVVLYKLNENGTVEEQVGEAMTGSIDVSTLSDDEKTQLKTEGKVVRLRALLDNVSDGISFDNFVAYIKDVNPVTFAVEKGGSVSVAGGTVTNESRGLAREASFASDEEVTFSIQTQDGYSLKKVLVDGIDKTADFASGTGTIGKVSKPSKVEVQFNGTPAPPVISDAKITGNAVEGQLLTLSYTYYDENDDAEDLSRRHVIWQMSDDGNEPWTDITESSSLTFRLTEAQAGKYVRAVVKACAVNEPFESNELVTNTIGRIQAGRIEPSAKDVSLEGTAVLGETVSVNYTYEKAVGGNDEGETYVVWEMSDTFDGEYFEITRAASLTITSNQAGKFIRATVYPVDQAGLIGLGVLSDAVKITKTVAYYVSTTGSDSNPGTPEKPFASLEKARDTIRENELPEGGVTVYIMPGTYPMSKTFLLEEQDSGREDAPIVYRSYGDGEVILTAGASLDSSKFKPVDSGMKGKLKSSDAQARVLETDLSEQGLPAITDPVIMGADSVIKNSIITYDGQLMHISRWPNDNSSSVWPKMYCDPDNPAFAGTNLGNGETDAATLAFTVQYGDDVAAEVASWTHNLDKIIAEGYWKYDWYSSARYVTLNKEKNQISAKENRNTQYGVYKGQWRAFRFMNIFEELDEAGEWYIDTNTNKLYLYPLSNSTNPEIKMSLGDFNMVSILGASHIRFQGLTMTGGKQDCFTISNADAVVIENCKMDSFEQRAASFTDCWNSGVKDSTISYTGRGGILLTGGDADNFVNGNNFVTNNVIHDFSTLQTSYAPAVNLQGFGNRIDHNEIYNTNHQAIQFWGSMHVIEYNVIHDSCLNAADMGAIYTGRRLQDHGTQIRYNHFYNIGNSLARTWFPCCIFIDDGTSDIEVYGNVFGPGATTTECNKVYRGQLNTFTKNLFIDVPVTFYNAAVQTNLWREDCVTWADNLAMVNTNEHYTSRWPWLLETLDPVNQPERIEHHGNTFSENLVVYVNEKPGSKTVSHGVHWAGYSVKPLELNTNVTCGQSADNKSLFADFDNGDYTLTQKAYDLMKGTGFEEIPFREMGTASAFNNPPYVENAQIYGNLALSRELRASYDYTDRERDPQGASRYRWLVSDTIDGVYNPIPGATATSFTVTDEQAGKFLKFEVTPVSADGTAGEPVLTPAYSVIMDVSSLSTVIHAIETSLQKAVVGDKLGNFAQKDIDTMKEALAAAKEIEADEKAAIGDIIAAGSALNTAYDKFKASAVNSQTVTENTVTVPQGLPEVTLIFPAASGTVNVTFEGGIAPKTAIQLTTGGHSYTIDIQNGTVIGTLPIGVPEQPGATLFGEITDLLSVGNAGDSYNHPIRIALTGSVKQDILRLANGEAATVSHTMSSDTAAALQAYQYGKYGPDDSHVAIWTTMGGEYVVADLTEPASDATLKEVFVNGKSVSRIKDKMSYTLPAGTTEAPVVTATANDPNATVQIEQATSANGTATITVTAQDQKTTHPYTIAFSVKKEDSYVTAPPINTNGSSSGTGTGGSSILSGNGGSRFDDITGHWAKNDIEAMTALGIVSGVTATTFEPDRSVTRAEFATLIVKTLKINGGTAEEFADVLSGEWYYTFVHAAASAGLIVGYDGYFRPDDPITREEMAVILARAYALRGGTLLSGGIEKFTDKDEISNWAYAAVDTVTTAGLISGMTPTTFVAASHTTRAQAVSVLKRLLD